MNALPSWLTVLTILAWNAPARADIPRPNRPPPQNQDNRAVAPVAIRYGAIRGEGRSVQAKITIPRSLLPGNNGGAVGAPPPAGAAPAAPPPAPRIQLVPPPQPEARLTGPPLGTVIAGIAMSLAAVSLVFMVRGNRTAKTLSLVLVATTLGTMAWNFAFADVAGQRRVTPPGAPPQAEIVIELTDFGDTVTLQLARP